MSKAIQTVRQLSLHTLCTGDIFKQLFKLVNVSIHIYICIHIIVNWRKTARSPRDLRNMLCCAWILPETQPSMNLNSTKRKSIWEAQQSTPNKVFHFMASSINRVIFYLKGGELGWLSLILWSFIFVPSHCIPQVVMLH